MISADIFTPTGLVAFRTIVATHDACPESLTFIDDCIAKQMTLEQCLLVMAEQLGDTAVEWFFWARTQLPQSNLPSNLRMIWTRVIAAKNPRFAAHLDLFSTNLSAAEAALCQAGWNADNLPNIARQLAEGIVKRPVR